MPFRMKDVAEKAGVSVTTVSHVLNKTRHRPVAAETRQRVLDAMRELNYQPDANARRLAQTHSNLFGLIVSEIANPFFPDVIRGFENAALSRGFELLLYNTEYEQARGNIAVRKMIENKVRGVAVVTSMLDPALGAQLASENVPVVMLGPGPAKPGISYIAVEYEQGMTQAVDHLIGLGHERIAFVAGPRHIASARRVCETFTDALAKRKLQPCHIAETNYKVDGGAAAVSSLLALPVFPTAVVCGNDLIAIGVISALEEVGISVPEDVSVVGCDNLLLARLARPPLTSIDAPRDGLGRMAFDALFKMKRAPARIGEVYHLQTSLVTRKSTAARTTREIPAGKHNQERS